MLTIYTSTFFKMFLPYHHLPNGLPRKNPPRLGRALWCLARHGGIQNALELFTGIGGERGPGRLFDIDIEMILNHYKDPY